MANIFSNIKHDANVMQRLHFHIYLEVLKMMDILF